MAHFTEYPECFKTLSLKLYDVMEDIGASTEIRTLMIDEFTAEEKLESFVKRPKYSVHVFGSAYEGSQTRGMKSDVDSVYVDEELLVVSDCDNNVLKKCLLLIQDHTTPPGYVKLQLVQDNVPLTEISTRTKTHLIRDYNYSTHIDGMKRLVCTFDPSSRSMIGTVGRHGPALTQIMNSHIADKDILFAFRSEQLPNCVKEWFTRKRRYGWPSQSDIIDCKSMGCLFVPIGHPSSDENVLQWRLSLSHQERLLVTRFNSVQLKCFILLKLVKKDIIKLHMQAKSLTSYHCKTCMLFMIENTPQEFWQPENLLAAFNSCMKMILVWTHLGVCPNYFIPAENMFERGIYGQVREELVKVMKLLSTAACGYLLQIKSDEIGKRLENSITRHPEVILDRKTKRSVIESRKMDLKYTHLSFALRTRTTLLKEASNELAEKQVQRLRKIIGKLQELESSEDSAGALEGAVRLVSAYLEIGHLSGIIATAVRKEENAKAILNHLTSSPWKEIAMRIDRFSPKLKQVCHLSKLGYFDESLHILSELNTDDCFSFCFCDQNRPVTPYGPRYQDSEIGSLSADHHLRKYMVPCVVFCLGEKDIIPDAIHYEIVHPSAELDQESPILRGKIAPVDGIFLLHFLYYINHRDGNMQTHVESDIENMETIVKRFKISHRYTALNLLGWAYRQQGNNNAAADCFYSSLSIKHEDNVAKWHIEQIKEFTDSDN